MPIDWRFIGSLEGQSVLHGYVPPYSDSGVTVATGVDLGQRSVADISKLAIPQDLQAILVPYALLRDRVAMAFLAAHPLVLTQPQSDLLDVAIREPVVGVFQRLYDVAVGQNASLVPFGQLCDPRQTVLASVAYQHGPHCRVKWPKFWTVAVEQNWTGLIAVLRNFGDLFAPRRNTEADYLMSHPC